MTPGEKLALSRLAIVEALSGKKQRKEETRSKEKAVVPVRPVADHDEERRDEQVPVHHAKSWREPECTGHEQHRRERRLEQIRREPGEIETDEFEAARRCVRRTPWRLMEPE